MLELAGASRADSRQAADAVFAFEKQLAEASLDNVALRDPKATDHKTTFVELTNLAPVLRLARVLRRGEAAAGRPQRAAAGVHEGARPAARPRRRSPTGRRTCAGTSCTRPPPSLSKPFVEENFAFYEQYLGGAAEMKPRWKRCVGVDGRAPRRGAREEVRREVLPAGGEGAHAGAGEEPAARDGRHDPRARLDERRRRRRRRSRSSRPSTRRSATRTSGRTTRGSTVARERLLGRRRRGPPRSNVAGRPRADRQARRPRALGHDAADLERLLQPAPQRDRLPGRHPPAAGVRREGGRRRSTTARSASSSATRSATASTTRARSTTRRGRLANWWTPERPRRSSRPRGQCVVDQFDGYFIEPGIHHNGKLVLGESIGDLAGAKIAYRAFQNRAEGKRAGADDRRLHARPAVLHRVGPVPRRRDPAGDAAADGAGRPAPDRQVPRDRPARRTCPSSRRRSRCPADAPMVRPPEKRCEVW